MQLRRRVLGAVVVAIGLVAGVALATPKHGIIKVKMEMKHGEVELNPDSFQAAIGDVVTVESKVKGGEFVLVFDAGMTDEAVGRSNGGEYSFVVRGYGHIGCTLLVDGQAVEAEYGGEILPDSL